jgi:hypothetical protein
VIRHLVETRVGERLGRRVTVARVRVNPFALAVTLDGARVFERDGRTVFLSFSRLHVDVEARSLIRRGLVVRELRLESPRVRVVRERAGPGGYNFSDIAARLGEPRERQAEAPAAPARGGPPRFSLSNLRVVDGALTYEDRPTGGRHEITELTLGVPFVSTLPADADVFVEPALSLRVDGAPFAVAARGRPFTGARDATARVHVSALDLTRWLPLLPVSLPVDVASASLDVDLDVAFVRRPRAAPTLTARGRVALARLDVRGERGAPLARLDALEVRVGEVDLAARRFVADEVKVTGLDVRVRRRPDRTLDWLRLLEGPPGHRPRRRAAAAPAAPLPLVEIGALTVAGAAVHLRDETARPPFEVEVTPIELSARRLSTAPGARGEVSLAVRATPGGTLRQQGTLSLQPLAASGSVDVEIPAVGRLRAFFHPLLDIDVASGRLRAAGRYRLEEARAGPRLVLSEVSLDAAKLVVGARGAARTAPFLRVPMLEVRDAKIDFGAHFVEIGRVGTRGGWVEILREANGHLRLTALLRRPPPELEPPAPPGWNWTLRLARLDLDRWNGRFEDQSVHPPVDVAVSSLAVHARDFRVAPRLRGHARLDLDVGRNGHVTVSDSTELDPLALEFRVNVTSAPIAPFQGYFVKYIGATIGAGEVSAVGRLALSRPAAVPGQTKRPVHLDIEADAQLANVEAFDAREGRELMRWSSLRIGGFALSRLPFRLAIRDVSLVNPTARLVRRADRRWNLGPFGERDGARDGEEGPRVAEPPAPASAGARFSIGRVSVRGGRLKLLDRSIGPPFFGEADGLEARLTGLSTDARTRAAVELRARINRAAPLAVSGTLNPLAGKPAFDLTLDLRDFDLPPVSPYAAKYAGHPVDKGKLSLSVRCHVAGGQLRSDNHIVIDQLALGTKVESPHATKAPVSLAASVLADRNGRIDLRVPVNGSLDNPSFKLGQTINRAIGNVLTRVVTAPFAVLAAAFRGRGGGETLSRIDFAPGSIAIDAAGARKLRALGEALRERRGLSFEIEGRADSTREGGGEPEGKLVVLARRRADAVREALVRAAPESGSRLFVVRARIAKGSGPHVQLRLRSR